MQHVSFLSGVSALMVFAGSTSALAAGGGNIITTYSVVDTDVTALPMPQGPNVDYSWANDINNGGDIVGSMLVSTQMDLGGAAFIHMDGQTYNLVSPSGWLGVFPVIAHGINDSRLVVGQYNDPSSPYQYQVRGFYYFPGIWLTPMQTNPVNDPVNAWRTRAYAVNNSGKAVGQTEIIGSLAPSSAGLCGELPVIWGHYTWYPSGFTCIPDPDGDGLFTGVPPAAHDINDSGAIVGTLGNAMPNSMFLLKGGTLHEVPKPKNAPSTKNGKPLHGVAFGINNAGKVVGKWGNLSGEETNLTDPADMTDGQRAFFWDGESAESQSIVVVRNVVASDAREVNSQDMVAGNLRHSYPTVPGEPRRMLGYIWHKDFGTVLLPALAYTKQVDSPAVPRDCRAMSINNRRSTGLVQVVGSCEGSNGKDRAVRWDIQVAVQTQVLDSPVAP